jgi:IS5 family transposase
VALRAMIRRRRAIEPAIGHIKTDGKLDRKWLKSALVMRCTRYCAGGGHNLRMILGKRRFFYALMRALLMSPLASTYL